MTSSERLPRPRFDSDAAYAARLDDVAFWAPYVSAVLRRHGLPDAPLSVGTVGSFPTLLAGEHVVKLFGRRFDGTLCFETEVAALRLLRDHPSIAAPVLLADGALFALAADSSEDDWSWPYLVMTRLPGRCWADAKLTHPAQATVARRLGTAIRHLHDLPPLTGPLWQRDWLSEFRSACVERQRRWTRLPEHLIEQIDGYLLDPLPDRRLLHADLHDHHLFVDADRLLGIVDWGDALVADRHYELPALHLHTFNADRRLLAAFLEGYGWQPGPDFVRRAMSMALIQPFGLLDRVSRTMDLTKIPTLDALADLIWRLP